MNFDEGFRLLDQMESMLVSPENIVTGGIPLHNNNANNPQQAQLPIPQTPVRPLQDRNINQMGSNHEMTVPHSNYNWSPQAPLMVHNPNSAHCYNMGPAYGPSIAPSPMYNSRTSQILTPTQTTLQTRPRFSEHGRTNGESSEEVAIFDDSGNTVGWLLPGADGIHREQNELLKYPVPCSKLTKLTTDWLLGNFEENVHSSLRRSYMFEAYTSYCLRNDNKPFNQAVFGKIVRACFPNVYTRRLGMRGQSRYHYAALGVKMTSHYIHTFLMVRQGRKRSRPEKPGPVFDAGGGPMHAMKEFEDTMDYNSLTLKKEKGKYDGLNTAGDEYEDDNEKVSLDAVSLILPVFPSASDIDPKFNCSEELMGQFLEFYQGYNKQLLAFIISLDAQATSDHLKNFFSDMPLQCQTTVLQTGNICEIIRICDDIMYQEATSALIPDCLAVLSDKFSDLVRNFAKKLAVWITGPCTTTSDCGDEEGVMKSDILTKRVQGARDWYEVVRRVTTLCHITKTVRKTLQDQIIVYQLMKDLSDLGEEFFEEVIEQLAFAGCQEKKLCGGGKQDVLKDKRAASEHRRNFINLLRDCASVEQFAFYLERILDKHAGMKAEPNQYSGPKDFEVATKTTKLFLREWAMISAKILAEFTVEVKDSVGTLHLLMLMFSDYFNHVICLRRERAARLKRQVAVIKKGSTYFKRFQTSVAAQNLNLQMLPHRTALDAATKKKCPQQQPQQVAAFTSYDPTFLNQWRQYDAVTSGGHDSNRQNNPGASGSTTSRQQQQACSAPPRGPFLGQSCVPNSENNERDPFFPLIQCGDEEEGGVSSRENTGSSVIVEPAYSSFTDSAPFCWPTEGEKEDCKDIVMSSVHTTGRGKPNLLRV